MSETFGSVVTVSIPGLGIDSVVAKVDTGAWSGALHCTDIYEDGSALYFTPLGIDGLKTSTAEYDIRDVKSTSGHRETRYIIPTRFAINDKSYSANIGLTDRTMMHREMLLGRKFLLDNNILVDVSLTVDDDKEAQDNL